MATHTQHNGDACFYFITFTCYRWQPLISEAGIYDFFKTTFRKMTERGLKVCGFVIMPNHVHILIYKVSVHTDLNSVISTSKRFLANRILNGLSKKGKKELLKQLSFGVTDIEISKGQRHRVFTVSFDAKEVTGTDQIVKVLDYMHHNPVNGRWALVDDFTEYPHSSAAFYELGTECDYPVFHFEDVG